MMKVYFCSGQRAGEFKLLPQRIECRLHQSNSPETGVSFWRNKQTFICPVPGDTDFTTLQINILPREGCKFTVAQPCVNCDRPQ